MKETQVQSLSQEDALEKEMATHFSILAWEILWIEEPGGLQSMGSQELDMTQQLNHHHYPVHRKLSINGSYYYYQFLSFSFPPSFLPSLFPPPIFKSIKYFAFVPGNLQSMWTNIVLQSLINIIWKGVSMCVCGYVCEVFAHTHTEQKHLRLFQDSILLFQ